MRVHITNLPDEVKTEELRQLVGMFGVIKSIVRCKDRSVEGNDGHVIVEMEQGDDARVVTAHLNGKEFKGCKLNVAI